MTDYTDLKARLDKAHADSISGSGYADEALAAIDALEAEVARLRDGVQRIRAELIARGGEGVGGEAYAYNDAALALRVLLETTALTAPTSG